ncbi:cyclic peptide export ABC transporter [Thermoactinomyces sp. DSM 45892]|uniref:cyclic peptide export ABC transporter n=1 Tax=Thermoactinomyces sp. DSM 45892 TaxID=1882753 RepID=UPI00089910E2|nr:cyclic peptide export ABC transporter [Thermoactinomyces sp. DSM 45892]SDY17962.1 cyclic peptide transporter [Thermoactinomyces sp. DSM 45892]
MRVFRLILLSLIICLGSFTPLLASAQQELLHTTVEEVEKFINDQKEAGKIPGLAIVVTQGDKTIYQKGIGYADIDQQKKIEPDTLFEIGSTSKAFTAQALLQLEEKGLVRLEDPITQYIPWLTLNYQGKPIQITVEQFLHHTSGVPFQTIGQIPSSTSDDALEKTVRNLVGIELSHRPGEKFEYATINYDVLGYIIQRVSGLSFEEYMQKNVFPELGLKGTYIQGNIPIDKMAVGYKAGFMQALEYKAPPYRGNNPAGYVVSSIEDIGQWLKIQMGSVKVSDAVSKRITKSHEPDRKVAPDLDGSSYAAGWSVYQNGDGGQIAHSGNNPNFSSYFAFRPKDQLGVAVLANMNSDYTAAIGQGIMNRMNEKTETKLTSDMYVKVDQVATAVTFILGTMALITLFFLSRIVIQIFRGKRTFVRVRLRTAFLTVVLLTIMGGTFVGAMYYLPDVFFQGLPWSFVYVWGPITILTAILSLGVVGMLFCLYAVLAKIFQKKNDKPIFYLGILSLIGGLGNGLIIFMINSTLATDKAFNPVLFGYFLMGIAIYVIGEKMVRTKLIDITNNIVYEKRMDLIGKILGTPYQNFEYIPEGKIYATLNNDTETISRFSTIVITGITSSVTLLFCFIYLGFINFYGLLVSLGVILLSVGLYFIIGRSANLMWEQTRDIQNVFFKFINDIVGGFKELYLQKGKRADFHQAIEESCDAYRTKRALGEKKFVNVFVIGELLFVFVIGAVAFFFPILFPEIQKESLISYVFVFLYMTGPVHGILNSFPELFRIRISWKRMNELTLDLASAPQVEAVTTSVEQKADATSLQIADVVYRYKSKSGETFSVGPLQYEFRSGEIVFITGGNGSGKSTLAKLITGLYSPDSGQVTMDHEPIDSAEIGSHFSTIFSDVYLFDRLYGVNTNRKQTDIQRYLKLLEIEDKISVDESGVLSTINLSTGQRKRVALMISYLEDKPFYLFDEWAADQDPEFRRFFYENLLPDLKKRGKCVIAVTHDDGYFHLADRVIKMEYGRILDLGKVEATESQVV